MLKAVIFDLFETLVTEFDPNFEPATPMVAARLGIPADLYRAEWIALHDARNAGEIGYEEALRRVCRAIGRPVDDGVIRQLHEDVIANHEPPFANVESEIVQALESVRAMGLNTALISNATAEEVGAWPGCPLPALMDHAVFSFEVGLIKPDAQVYQLACDRLGVAPEQCIFVGDGGSNELPGAEGVGMRPYCATWFIDRFPEDVRLSHGRKWNINYPKLHTAAELIEVAERLARCASRLR